VYVRNDPVNFIDPFGLADWEFCFNMGASEYAWCVEQCTSRGNGRSIFEKICGFFSAGDEGDDLTCQSECLKKRRNYMRHCLFDKIVPVLLDNSDSCSGNQCVASR
jgi:hypothetical protein